MYNKIYQVDLISNSTCDMKCEFCFLRKNKTFTNYNKIVQEKWKNGEYVKNIKKLFSFFKSDPKKVRTLEFWGGETLLNIKTLLPSMEELISFFSEIETFVIPTNGLNTNIKDLCQLISIIDKNLSKRDKRLLHFHIQLSIDGMPNSIIMKEGHNGDWDKYKKNFDELCEELNKIELKNTSVDIVFLGNASDKNWINSFKDYKDLKELIQFWNKVNKYVNDKIKENKNKHNMLTIMNDLPKIALPHHFNLEEILNLEKIIRLNDYVVYQEKGLYEYNQTPAETFYPGDATFIYGLANYECPEADQNSITILPDGTVPFCPCAYLQHLPEYQKEVLEKEDYKSYKNCLIYSYYFFNPLTATEEEIEKHKWYMLNSGIKDTYFPYIYYSYNMAKELALSRQIDFNYFLDDALLFEEITAASTIGECRRENLNYTNIPYLTDENLIRTWLNGYTQYYKRLFLTQLKERMKIGLQND